MQGDYPEIKGDQSLYMIRNDMGNIHTETNGSFPMGIEQHIMFYGYKCDDNLAINNSLFVNMKIYNRGNDNLNDFYAGTWLDPDLGNYLDDYVGCNVEKDLGYVYNGDDSDDVFNGIFDMPAPAGGYDFLKSPVNENGIELGMTAFTYFGAGSSINDPDLGSYSGSLQFYNLMEGFLPRPEYPEQVPWTDPTTGESTRFTLSGDPITGEGWLDGMQLPPGDRRLVMSSGWRWTGWMVERWHSSCTTTRKVKNQCLYQRFN